jgi:hypothetical protein
MLTPKQRRELIRIFRTNWDRRLAIRAQIILLAADGRPPEFIGKVTFAEPGVVEDVLRRFEEGGVGPALNGGTPAADGD